MLATSTLLRIRPVRPSPLRAFSTITRTYRQHLSDEALALGKKDNTKLEDESSKHKDLLKALHLDVENDGVFIGKWSGNGPVCVYV